MSTLYPNNLSDIKRNTYFQSFSYSNMKIDIDVNLLVSTYLEYIKKIVAQIVRGKNGQII